MAHPSLAVDSPTLPPGHRRRATERCGAPARRLAVALLAVVHAPGVARAQPVTQPELEPCRVTIALAPSDVRAEIEAWVRAEPRCENELEIRVVPTDDGLYLSARDQHGHVRERVVPDAQSAAVLVVSWMADDSLGPTFPRHTEREPPTPTERAPAATLDNESPFDPGPPGLSEHASISGAHRARWLTLGAITSSEDRIGVRGQLDLLRGRWWSIGAAGGWRPTERRGADMGADGSGQARVVVSARRSFGAVSLRAQLGLGADVSTTNQRMDDRDAMDGDRRVRGGAALIPKAEAAVFADVRVLDSWGLIGGPIVDASLGEGGPPQLSIFFGVQHGL